SRRSATRGGRPAPRPTRPRSRLTPGPVARRSFGAASACEHALLKEQPLPFVGRPVGLPQLPHAPCRDLTLLGRQCSDACPPFAVENRPDPRPGIQPTLHLRAAFAVERQGIG